MSKNPINELLKPILIFVLLLIILTALSNIAWFKQIKEDYFKSKRIVDVTECAEHATIPPLFFQCVAKKVCESDFIQSPIGEYYFYKLRAYDPIRDMKDWDTIIKRSNNIDIDMKNACDSDKNVIESPKEKTAI